MNLQDFLSSIAQADTVAMSAYEFIRKRSEAASSLLTNIQEACSTDELVVPDIDSEILIQIEDQALAIRSSVILQAINAGADVITVINSIGDQVEVSIEHIIDQLTDSVSASYAVAESFWVLGQTHLKTAAEKMQAYSERMTMKFSSLPDIASSYGYAILGVLEDNNASIIEKTKTILSFIGFGDTPPTPNIPIPSCDLSDITGANVYTAFSAEVTEGAENAYDVASNVFTKIGKGIKKVVNAVAEPVVTKVKQAYGTIMTTHDAWLVADADSVFRGFTDMGSVVKYEVGVGNSLASKLSTHEYVVFELGLCRAYCWLDPSGQYYYIKTYTRPLPYNAFTYGTKTVTTGGNPAASINDLVIALMSDGSVAAPTVQEIFSVTSEVLSMDWETPGEYEVDEYNSWSPDNHMWYSIKHSQMAAALVLLAIVHETTGLPISYANLQECVKFLFGDPADFMNSTPPENVSNLDLARALTGCYGSTVTPGSVYYEPFGEWDTRAFITNSLGNIIDGDDYYFPYYRTNSIPSGMYAVYRDSQLSSVVSTLVITVMAVVAAIVILKTIGKAKRSVFTTRAKAANLERQAFTDPANIDQNKLNAAYKLNKKANLLQRLTSSFAGSTKSVVGLTSSSNGFMQTSGQFNLNTATRESNQAISDVSDRCTEIVEDVSNNGEHLTTIINDCQAIKRLIKD